jgi:hypothetical protein
LRIVDHSLIAAAIVRHGLLRWPESPRVPATRFCFYPDRLRALSSESPIDPSGRLDNCTTRRLSPGRQVSVYAASTMIADDPS